MREPLVVWTNAQLSSSAAQALKDGVGEHRLLVASQTGDNLTAAGDDPDLPIAQVAFGQPNPAQLFTDPAPKWTHLTSAGYTRYDRADLRTALLARGATMTNSSSVYDEPCAQHLLAFILAANRCLPESTAAQVQGPKWDYERLRPMTRLLLGDTVLLVGYGAIAKRLAELLAPFHPNIIAFRRSVHGDEAVRTLPIDQLEEHLPSADHVVNVLPANSSTENLFNPKLFARMKPSAGFYNVGRGNTVDQDALIKSLTDEKLRVAYLDVTDPEPLPIDHPLWKAPNCHITPHIAGGHQDEHLRIVMHFLANLHRFEQGEPLLDRII